MGRKIFLFIFIFSFLFSRLAMACCQNDFECTPGSCDQSGEPGCGTCTGPETCFLPGTMISMADGTKKNIENIKVGDMVLSFTIDGKNSGQTTDDYYVESKNNIGTANIYDPKFQAAINEEFSLFEQIKLKIKEKLDWFLP
ncbi:MAG: hypothetical protein WC069_03480 [Candidatus Shapirobacteria bacterium]